jgi:hypothetical protein
MVMPHLVRKIRKKELVRVRGTREKKKNEIYMNKYYSLVTLFSAKKVRTNIIN